MKLRVSHVAVLVAGLVCAVTLPKSEAKEQHMVIVATVSPQALACRRASRFPQSSKLH